MQTNKENTIKCVVIGDARVGKTSLVRSYATNEFPGPYTPTASDTYSVNVLVASKPITFSLTDTGGNENYDQLRLIAYPNTDIFLCCFSIVNPTSFEQVRSKWFPEITSQCPNTPIILVGTKMDLSTDPSTTRELKSSGQNPVLRDQGLAMVQDIGAITYKECSASTQEGVKEVFDAAIGAIANPGGKGKKNKDKEETCGVQ